MRLRPSHKISIGAAATCAALYFGWQGISSAMVMGKKFEPLRPGTVNLVGVDTDKGYYIVVANQVAQLVFGKRSEFEGGAEAGAASESSDRRRIPLREMLMSLNGDERALGKFIMKMNGMSDAELPAVPRLWNADDVQKAIDGDASLRSKLESDLNVRLDGTPLNQIRTDAIQEGIVLQVPVTVKFGFGSSVKEYKGVVREEFRPRFMRDLDKALAEKSAQTADIIRGYYTEAAQKVLDGETSREPVGTSLASRISLERRKSLAQLPNQILNSITIIVNETNIDSATVNSYPTQNGKRVSDLTLNLSGEGKDRLWQYSKKHTGDQLLVVWDGIAIAAPRIAHELAFSDVKITQLADESLATDTMNAINELKNKRKP